MFQLPNAEGREEQTLGASERADGGQLSHIIFPVGGLPRTPPARFRFADAACGLANREMTTVIHNY